MKINNSLGASLKDFDSLIREARSIIREVRYQHNEAELDALKQAALKLEKLLLSNGITEEELFADFRALRQEKKEC